MHDYNHGRFTSPDPMMASANINYPQTLNRYIYVLNNPLNLTDPTGMIAGCPEGKPCEVDDKGNEYYIGSNGGVVYTGVVAAVVTVGKEVAKETIKEPGIWRMLWFHTKRVTSTVVSGGSKFGKFIIGGGVVGTILTNPTSVGNPHNCRDANGNNFCMPTLSTDADVDDSANPDEAENEPKGNKAKKKQKKKKKRENQGGRQNNQRSKKQVNSIANKFGLDRIAFGDYVEERKKRELAPGTDWTYRQLEDLGRDFQNEN